MDEAWLLLALDIQGLKRGKTRRGPGPAQSSQVTRRPDPGQGLSLAKYYYVTEITEKLLFVNIFDDAINTNTVLYKSK